MLGEHSAPGVGSGGCIFGVRKRRGANPVAGLIAFLRACRARSSAGNFVSGALDRLVLYMGNMEWSLFLVLNFEGLILARGRTQVFLVLSIRQNIKVRESAHFRTSPRSMRWKGTSIVEPSFFVENRDFSGLETVRE